MKYLFSLIVACGMLTPHMLDAQGDSTQKNQNELRDVIPVVAASSDDLSESVSNQNVSGMLASTRDIYAATSAFRLTQAGFRYRGYRNDQFSTIINGVFVNDPENGQSFWGGWGAFNEVLTNRDGNIGLSASSYAFGGLGGSYHIDARAGGQRKGLSVSYALTNRNYNNRISAAYSTGYLKGGWAITLAASRRWAVEGYEKGTSYDGYGYFLSIEKKLGEKQSLNFTAFGTPTVSARAGTSVREMQQIANDNYYNPDWGYQNGQIRSSNVNKRFEPAFMLTHEVKFSNKTNLITGVDFEFGKNRTSLIDYNNAASPLPDYYHNLPSYALDASQAALEQSILSSSESARQIQWDNLYAANRSQSMSANGRQSSYVTADNVQDSKRFNLNSTLNHTLSEHVSLTAGITYQWEKVRNYKELTDLLGGDYYTNLNTFAIQDFPTNPDVLQNDLQHPNRVIHVGDAYGYDFNSQIHKGSGWIQPYFKFNHVEFFVAGQLTESYYWRSGNVQNGLFPTSSLGDSKKISFLNYAIKAGVQYKINGKNYLYLNGTTKTAPPTFNNSFLSTRIQNGTVPNLSAESIYSGELGYQYKSANFKLKASAFFTQTVNEIQTRTFFHEDYRTNVNYNISGLNERSFGGELGVEAKIYKGLSTTLVANIGSYQYSDNAQATITKDNSNQVLATDQTIYTKNFYIGGMPQMSTSLGFRYTSKKYWYATINFNYFDRMYATINPVRRTLDAIDLVPYGSAQYTQIMHQEQMSGQFTMDMTGGYNWFLNKTFKHMGSKHKYYLNFYATLTNLTNNRNFIINNTEQLRYDFQQKDIAEFANKYRYMHGFGYFVSVAFKFQ
jgi:hypothetical protein